MNLQLTPDLPAVEQWKILNLVVKRENGSIVHKQYLTIKEFDYGEMLETVRQQDIIKSDEVLQALTALLIEGDYVREIDTYVLDLGVVGRPSEAVRDLYRHTLNHGSSHVKTMLGEINRRHFEFDGPEGRLHVLKVDHAFVLGHVHISLEGSGLYDTTTLDIIGPTGSDFPEDFNKQIHDTLTQYLLENHPELDVILTVRARRSEVTQSEDVIYARS